MIPVRSFRYRLDDTLPRLAWVAVCASGVAAVDVTHGVDVETRGAFFVEGCWDAPFGEGGFDQSSAVFATGGVVRGEAVVFVPPAHTLDSLFHATRDGATVVSNSLALLLAHLGDRLIAERPGYDALLDSVALGIDAYQATIPTRHGAVQRLLFRNLRVEVGSCRVVDKPASPPLPDYDAYARYLEATYAALVANARDGGRRQPLAIYSTQSRGYDTTAINSIAAAHGLDKVFTCTRGRDKSAFTGFEREAPDDDGTAIGRTLGFECVAIDRLAYQKDPGWDEALYYAGAHSIQDVNLMDVNRHVSGVALLLTGTLGEIWRGREYYDPHHLEAVGPQLWRSDLAGHGLGEVRLVVGLVFLPLPYIGAQRREEILAIASRPEMARWRLGRGYDKPLARRIAEERGVPRELFGISKLNSTVSLPRPPVPLHQDLRARYFAFLLRSGLVRRWQLRALPWVHKLNQVLYYYSPRRYRTFYYASRLLSRVTRREWGPALLLGRLNGTLHAFCVNEVADRYARVSVRRREETPGSAPRHVPA